MNSQEPQIAQQRKNDHVKYALAQQGQLRDSSFEEIRFVHHSFNQVDFPSIDLSTEWAQHQHALPFYINGMTGGSQFTKQFNRKLAQVAATTGLAMASGSVSAALKDPSVANSFTVIRQENPQGFVLANIGAHHGVDNAKRAVDLLAANALQIHLNIPQEVVMPEGDRDFTTWSANIEKIVDQVGVPVIVKEVGFGMSKETIEHIIDLGVQTVDISGRGGTNFIKIENERRDQLDFSALASWGQTTVESLLEAQPYLQQVEVLASGGIRHYLDILKALALGARATGLSGHFLKSVQDQGVQATIAMVDQWQDSLKHMLLLLGCQNLDQVRQLQLVLSPALHHWAQVRQLDLKAFYQAHQYVPFEK
ncbi:type 2 isopentenyl-diphosphate Delta-isomerase [Ignavigranum ruoffiae]|uniref:type 2 isopentenyl-diphosphate Delta-isomerase n=1 Tax=Ignavigranum ruoffiae TaxID=89093 RepID=UPI00206ECF59|nr:type 2 isopentenyl-diphosphate Delta-isomerase [Ignavigranum ruoffiae]UPQ86060.1 type 2 isopentenyl-diphosphate Delta-isomerase [Ignavigranum ruoffiae]